jgi:hypothetical protein
VGSGAAISVTNTTAAFVIAGNLVEGPTGISVTADASWSLVEDNQVIVHGSGIVVSGASTGIVNNTLQPGAGASGSATAIVTTGASVQVYGNAIDEVANGIVATQGSVSVCANDVQNANVGILVQAGANATVCGNVVAHCGEVGIKTVLTVGSLVVNNTVQSCVGGIFLMHDKDVNATANLVVKASVYGILCEQCGGTVSLNTVIDGWADGIELWKSTALFADNNVSNNLGAAFNAEGGAATIRANLVLRNGVGVTLWNQDTAHLEANVLANNTVGLDVPYGSRQAVASMSGNVVNGVNVDGTLRAGEQVFFYKAANVTIAGGVRDSGFSAGYFGSVSAEGNVVLYEVDTATIDGTLIGHADVGVMAVNSFNVVVRGATITQARVGVAAYGTLTGSGEYGGVGEVPACVVSVKNTSISIPVDPAGTIGISAEACRVQVSNTSVSLVDTGILVDAGSQALIVNASVHDTRVGLDLTGTPHDINVTGTVIARNQYGILARGSVGAFVDDQVTDNVGPGMALLHGARVEVMGSAFLRNGAGLVDAQPCGAPASCGQLVSTANVFAQNRGDGVAVNGTTRFEADQLVDNRGDGARVGSTTLRGVTASGNLVDGVAVSGTFLVRGSTFDHNGRHGATLVGAGDLRNVTSVWNAQAGLRLSPAGVTAADLYVADNFDGILLDEGASAGPVAVPPPSVQGVWGLLGLVAPTASPATLDVHHSAIVANERDAIRAGGQVVNATSNWWGSATGPALDVGDQIGAFQNGVSPTVRFVPYYTDAGMTTVGPVPLL